jgi:hypothetical protein
MYIGGDFDIHWNNHLNSITGFELTNLDSINNLFIYENPYLTTCTSPAICSLLADPFCPVNIYANNSGCNNPAEAAQGCGVPVVCLPMGSQYFLNQTEIDNFPVLYSGCTSLNGNTFIGGNNVNNLNGLNQITSIAGNLQLSLGPNNTSPVLTDLQGLNNVDTISGNFSVLNLGHLTSLSGLDSLEYIGGNLNLNSISNLASLSALHKLKSVRDVEIILNRKLVSLSGLDSLNRIRGSLRIINNELLNDLSALSNIDSIEYTLEIEGLSSPENLEDFYNLKYVGIGISIHHNPFLTSLKGLDNIA